MSNRRRVSRGNTYRTGYLRSPAWFARRDRWLDEEEHASGGGLHCAACTRPATRRQLELHHTDYAGVTEVDGKWQAGEAHQDLVALHPYCHELLHRLLERDKVLANHRSRRDASAIALRKLRQKLTKETTA